MKFNIYCVRDAAVDQFGNPMFLIADGQAVRSFTDEVNRNAPDNNVYNHPDDFELFHLGSFDTTTGIFESHSPRSIARGVTVKVR